MTKVAQVIVRLLEAILNAINRSKKKDMATSAAESIANGGRVQYSRKTIADIPDEHERDSN